ncbi:sialidase family protein [Methylococcus sp. ANG]|uniref:sialidase family protein n=1 Tax=Methylococcus sp. ANG TaxID=3231903 RepID=UPI003457F94C
MSATFDQRGGLWRVSISDSLVLIDRSSDFGKTFSVPTVVNPDGQRLKAQSEDRPSIAVDRAGRVLVTYPAEGRQAMTTYLAVSGDGGRHFSEPKPVSERWEEVKDYQSKLVVDGDSRPYVYWHDERDRRDYREVGLPMYYALLESSDTPNLVNRKVVNDTCECCRIAAAFEPDGTPVVLSRMIYPGGVRDHGLIRRDAGDWKTWRVTFDDWKIDACPEHGPALSIGDRGTYHIVWFTQGDKRQGLFYARSPDRGRTFSAPVPVGSREDLAGHADVVAVGPRVVLIWLEFDGTRHRLRLRSSEDDGGTWSADRTVAETVGPADYPLLLNHGGSLFVSWNTKSDGYRLLHLP